MADTSAVPVSALGGAPISLGPSTCPLSTNAYGAAVGVLVEVPEDTDGELDVLTFVAAELHAASTKALTTTRVPHSVRCSIISRTSRVTPFHATEERETRLELATSSLEESTSSFAPKTSKSEFKNSASLRWRGSSQR